MTIYTLAKHCIIAGHHVIIDTEDQELLGLLAPRYAHFACRQAAVNAPKQPCCPADDVLFHLKVVDALEPLANATMMSEFDCEGALCRYLQTDEEVEIAMYDDQPAADGQHPLLARMRCGKDYAEARCMLSGHPGRRVYCCNNFLMMLFAFASMSHQTILFHASVIARDGKAYLFLAKSGTGKSTHSALWLKHVPGCSLVNDDNPIVTFRDGQVTVYGSPWSGKTPCYRNVQYPLGGLICIQRDQTNHIERQQPLQAFATLLSSCSGIHWDRPLYKALCGTLSNVLGQVPCYVLGCRPDREAAVVCSMGVGAWDGSEGDFSLNEESMKPNAVHV